MSAIDGMSPIIAGLSVSGAGPFAAGGSAGSGFGPAFLLGGSSANPMQGLYSALGQLTQARQLALLSQPSPAEQQRVEALQAAAKKIDSGDIAGGRADAEAILAKNKTDVGAIATIGRSYVVEGNYDEAEKYYVRAAALAPNSEQLSEDVDNVRLLKKSDAEVLAVARQKLASPGSLMDGLRLLTSLTDRSPDNVEAYLATADGYAAAGAYAPGILVLKEALTHAEPDDAEKIIERAQAFVSDHPEIGLGHNVLGLALQKAGRYDEAIGELKSALDIAQDNHDYAKELSGAYLARTAQRISDGELASAGVDLEEAIGLNPGNLEIGNVSAALNGALAEQDITGGRYTAAVTHLDAAYADAPTDAAFRQKLSSQYLRVGRHYQSKNDKSAALNAYRKAYQLDPTSEYARRNTAEISYAMGVEARDAGHYREAVSKLDQAYRLDRSNSVYRTNLAGAYDLRGQELLGQSDLNGAIAALEKGYRLDPDNAALAAHYFAALDQRDS